MSRRRDDARKARDKKKEELEASREKITELNSELQAALAVVDEKTKENARLSNELYSRAGGMSAL